MRHNSMLRSLLKRGKTFVPNPSRPPPPSSSLRRSFRSQGALDALHSHCGTAGVSTAGARSALVLYNYPSFSGTFAALFAHLFHTRLRLPFFVLPFSSVEPFRVEDFKDTAFETCYLLDFIGPERFAVEISQFFPRVIAFDHRETTLRRILQVGECSGNLELRVDTNKSSARAVYEYFSEELSRVNSSQGEILNLVQPEDEERITTLLKYIEDVDLRLWRMPDIKAFMIGLRDERAKINCITNPCIFEQLLQIDSAYLIAKGISFTNLREDAAKKLLERAFKIKLGRGLYGECLAVRADGNSDLSHEIGIELSRRSAACGLRPIGAVIYMQKRNLKMCLRSTDSVTNTSEIAKAYGGGGKLCSSSFIIRMDEYNYWTSSNAS